MGSNDNSTEIFAYMPGAIMYKAPFPSGIPKIIHLRSRHIYGAKNSNSLAIVGNLDFLISSLQQAFNRSFYHHARFNDITLAMKQRKENSPGEIFWDSLVQYLYFELQAMLGSIRTSIDELVFVIEEANKNTATIGRRYWKASELFKDPMPCDQYPKLPEYFVIKKYFDWYKKLNAYRNAFYHSGSIHGHSYGNYSDNKSLNTGLILPDIESLTPRSKPSDWTWNHNTAIIETANEIFADYNSFLEDLLINCWNVPIPQLGKISMNEEPEMIVSIPTPACLRTDKDFVIPIFSTKDKALKYPSLCQRKELEIAQVETKKHNEEQNYIAISRHQIMESKECEKLRGILIILDPNPVNIKKSEVENICKLDVKEICKEDLKCVPIQIVIPKTLKYVYLWRAKVERQPFIF